MELEYDRVKKVQYFLYGFMMWSFKMNLSSLDKESMLITTVSVKYCNQMESIRKVMV